MRWDVYVWWRRGGPEHDIPDVWVFNHGRVALLRFLWRHRDARRIEIVRAR